MTNAEIFEIALEQHAIDCNCSPSDFLSTKNVVSESRSSERARVYLKLPQICDLVTYGNNVVACCTKELMPSVEHWLQGDHPFYSYFETPTIYELNKIVEPVGAKVCHQAEYFLPDVDAVYSAELSCPYELRILGPEDFADLYVPAWANAICEKRRELDVLGVGAYDGETLVGLAGSSADCADMWQVGIDVLPDYRRQGIASALTNRLARETIERGKVPFYCAAWSNIRSVRNALICGFKPAWMELYVRSLAEVEKSQGEDTPPEDTTEEA